MVSSSLCSSAVRTSREDDLIISYWKQVSRVMPSPSHGNHLDDVPPQRCNRDNYFMLVTGSQAHSHQATPTGAGVAKFIFFRTIYICVFPLFSRTSQNFKNLKKTQMRKPYSRYHGNQNGVNLVQGGSHKILTTPWWHDAESRIFLRISGVTFIIGLESATSYSLATKNWCSMLGCQVAEAEHGYVLGSIYFPVPGLPS